MIKHATGNLATFFNVAVPAISYTGNNTYFFGRFHIFQVILNGLIAGWIMRKVNKHFKFLEFKNIQPSRCQCRTWDEGAQGVGNILNSETIKIGSQRCRQYIGDHELRFSFHRDWDIVGFCNPDFPIAFFNGDETFFKNAAYFSFPGKFFNVRIVLIKAENSHFCIEVIQEFHGIFIFSIENIPAVFFHCIEHHSFNTGQILKTVDIAQTQVIFFNIGQNTDIAGTETQTGAQNSAARSFEHGKFHSWIFQNKFR